MISRLNYFPPFKHQDLISIEPISGPPGEVGSKARLQFKQFDLIETITVKDMPREFSGSYEAAGICSNTMQNRFTPLGENRTRYEAEVDYQFTGKMVKLMAFLMPWMFKRQVQQYLERFKALAEREGAS